LNPAYRVFFDKDEIVDISPDLEKNFQLFEHYQHGSQEQFKKYLTAAEYQYQIAMNEFIYKEYRHLWISFTFPSYQKEVNYTFLPGLISKRRGTSLIQNYGKSLNTPWCSLGGLHLIPLPYTH